MIYNKISDIMNEIIPLGKIRREEIVSTLLPILAKHKIVIKPGEIKNYSFMKNESSFIATYEVVDTEDPDLKSILVEVPAGGCDTEEKGRSTYMASTGAYRQMFQQLFALPIEDELPDNSNNTNNNDFDNTNNANNDFVLDEFQGDNTVDETNGTNITPDNQNMENNNTTTNTNAKPISDFTFDDIDEEFSNF